jgi:hypothetical protein
LCLACGAASGNLVFDGVHAFQYDGFGRVVQVNRASLPANAPPEIASLVVGPMVKHYTYDAFGRLIRVQSPFPDPESGGDLGLRVERLYYDGLRRIQEVNIDPSLSMNMAASGQAGGAMQAAANQVAMNAEEPLDGSAAPATLESQALESEVIPATVTYLAREYVWGNGDWGVDELLAQYDADRRASWPLQDAGGDVIALCDRGGANGTARVITQIVYDAHGSVIDRDDPYGMAASAGKELRVGHKGLFFDRLDAGISDPVTGQETPRLWPGVRLSGYARNRTLHCDFGRWNQPDPNATGLPVQAGSVFHGQGLKDAVQRFDLESHFGDGVNLYSYALGRPTTVGDPLGLFGLLGGLSTGMSMADMASDMMDGAFTGVLGGLGLILMVDEYDAYVDTAMDWAFDWSQPDDAYARSASWSAGIGYWSDEDETIDSDEDTVLIAAIMAGVHDHHGFPQEFREKFRRLGINIDDPKFRPKLKDVYHLRAVHGKNASRQGGAYNKFWGDFLDRTKGMPNAQRRTMAISRLKTIKQNGWRIPKKWR